MKEMDKAPEMVLTIGIPGSGKSTFCRENLPQYRRISLDLLHTRKREDDALREALDRREPCVIDNTNVTKRERVKYLAAAKEAGYRVTGFYFRSRIGECLARNALRTGKECIPKAGVLGRAKDLELPEYAEGFDRLYYVAIENDRFTVRVWEDESCEK